MSEFKDDNTGWKKIGKYQYKTVTLNIDLDDFSENTSYDPEKRRQLQKWLHKLADNKRNEVNLIHTTIFYEFYDENDDWYPNQKDFLNIFEFQLDYLDTTLTLEEIRSLVYFKHSGGKENVNKIFKERIENNGQGLYEYLDTYAYYEERSSYCNIYMQYKIKKLNP